MKKVIISVIAIAAFVFTAAAVAASYTGTFSVTVNYN